MTDLIARLEAATEGSRELDAEPVGAEWPASRKNCPVCGRFMQIRISGRRQCPKVFSDDYSGGWDHD